MATRDKIAIWRRIEAGLRDIDPDLLRRVDPDGDFARDLSTLSKLRGTATSANNAGNDENPNDENDYERGARDERTRIEAELWKVMETTPKDGLSGAMACVRGLVSLAKSVESLRESRGSVRGPSRPK